VGNWPNVNFVIFWWNDCYIQTVVHNCISISYSLFRKALDIISLTQHKCLLCPVFSQLLVVCVHRIYIWFLEQLNWQFHHCCGQLIENPVSTDTSYFTQCSYLPDSEHLKCIVDCINWPVCRVSAAVVVVGTCSVHSLHCYSMLSAGQCVQVLLLDGGTVAAAPPSFRPGNPALCGSHPLVTPY